ncbi:esterase [Planctomycetes bacterium MalM25]|nr:esterase [Planctomycetes bacterium MalM25]
MLARSLLLLLFASAVSHAEEPLDGRITPAVLAAFERQAFDDEGFELPYRLLAPADASDTDRRPLVLFLHGFGERGEENQRQLIHGGTLFASEAFRQRYGAYVVAPQCTSRNHEGTDRPIVWPTLTESKEKWRSAGLDAEISGPLRAVKRLVDHLLATQPIDPDRVYVTGLSMGGYGSWELAARYPDAWAAAAPICGGGLPEWGERLTRLPVWAFHGDADGAVPVERSRNLIAAINAAGGRAIYTEYPGVGHDSWTPTFASQQVWDWLFTQRR